MFEQNPFIILFLFILFLSSFHQRKTESFVNNDHDSIINPEYLNNKNHSYDYALNTIKRQKNENSYLRNRIKELVSKIEDCGGTTRQFYRRKLSNNYYPVMPHISSFDQNYLNLYDDDFSTKTFSNVAFLSQTRSSKFFDDKVHFPNELCGNFCSTEDPNFLQNEQIDGIRYKPISNDSTTRINK